VKYTFRNTAPAATTVILEPWAEEFLVPSGSLLSIEISAAEDGLLETVLSDEYFVVWLWGGCRATVSLDGKDQARPALSIAAP
jgi:hypothetical protein